MIVRRTSGEGKGKEKGEGGMLATGTKEGKEDKKGKGKGSLRGMKAELRIESKVKGEEFKLYGQRKGRKNK